MIDNKAFNDAHQHVNDAHAITVGILSVLDAIEEEIAVDSRGYALMACLNEVARHLVEASNLLDEYAMGDEKQED